MTSKLITCFIDGSLRKGNPNQLLIYSMEVNIYIGLDLEDEVHLIWVIWTSGLHSWGRTIGMKDKINHEGQSQ